jgi:hypothetical protein
MLRAIMDISAPAVSLAVRPRTGHLGRQGSQALMANAPKITSGFVGKENISAEIYLLRGPFEAPANPGKRGKIYVGVDSDEHISVLGDGLGSRQ